MDFRLFQKCCKLWFGSLLLIFNEYWSLYGQLLLYAYHVKLRKAYVKLVITCEAAAKAYARLSIRDDLLFDDIADEVLRRPQEFSAIDLYLLANAFASFHIRHPRLWLTLADWLLQTHLDLGAVEVYVAPEQ